MTVLSYPINAAHFARRRLHLLQNLSYNLFQLLNPVKMKKAALVTLIVLFVLLLDWWFLAPSGDDPSTTEKSSPTAALGAPFAGSPFIAIAKGRIDIEGGLIRLAASRDGLIREVRVEEGDFVKRNQILAVIDDRLARLQLDQAQQETAQAKASTEIVRARLTGAEREATRAKALLALDGNAKQDADERQDTASVVRAELDAASAAVNLAKSREAVARYEVEQRIIRAPVNGQIVRRMAKPGDGSSTFNVTALFLFAPEASRIVRAELDERFVRSVRPGMRAEVVIEADETQRFKARVIRVGQVFGQRTPSDDPAERADTRVVECVLAIDEPSLLIGQRVLVKVLSE